MDVHACLTCMHPTCGIGGDVMFVSMSYTQSVHYSYVLAWLPRGMSK